MNRNFFVPLAFVWLCLMPGISRPQGDIEQRIEAAVAAMDADEGAEPLQALSSELEAAVAKVPSVELYLNLGRVYFYLEEDTAAEKALRKALELDSENVDAIRFLGLLDLYAGRLEEAEVKLRQALALAPEDYRNHRDLGDVLSQREQFEDALAAYERALKQVPEDPQILRRLAFLLADRGETERATATLERLVAMGTDDPTIFYNLGQARQNAGHHEKALASFRRVLELDSEDWRARAKVVQELQALKRAEERDAMRDELIAQRGRNPDSELGQSAYYCRDQFEVGDLKIFAFEMFELVGEQPRLYEFRVTNASTGEESRIISLGSYDITTAIMRETGKIGANERAYHLDSYSPDYLDHSAFAFFVKPPPYDDVRSMVVEILKGEMSAISSSSKSRSQ